MNNSYVTDTMALILRLEKRKLSSKIKALFEKAENGEIEIIIPAMVLAEIGYLSEKKKIETNLNEIKKYCKKYNSIFIEPITEKVIEKAFEIKELMLITNDPIISNSKFVKVIW